MSRYIEADAVITAIAEFNKYEDELEYPYASDDLEEYKDDARLLIEDAPSIDIVRCKECRHFGKNDSILRGEWWCDFWADTIEDDGYCSYGVRTTNTTAEEKPTPIRDYMVHGERREP